MRSIIAIALFGAGVAIGRTLPNYWFQGTSPKITSMNEIYSSCEEAQIRFVNQVVPEHIRFVKGLTEKTEIESLAKNLIKTSLYWRGQSKLRVSSKVIPADVLLLLPQFSKKSAHYFSAHLSFSLDGKRRLVSEYQQFPDLMQTRDGNYYFFWELFKEEDIGRNLSWMSVSFPRSGAEAAVYMLSDETWATSDFHWQPITESEYLNAIEQQTEEYNRNLAFEAKSEGRPPPIKLEDGTAQ